VNFLKQSNIHDASFLIIFTQLRFCQLWAVLLVIFIFYYHRIPSQGNAWLERGRESRLVIDNVTYIYQGEYECRASNFINGQERSTTSDPISLQVVGAPQVLRPNSSGFHVSVKRGDSASLSLVVCADPRPRHVGWEWGSLRLEAGSGIGMYISA
jgi:hypothetical protein